MMSVHSLGFVRNGVSLLRDVTFDVVPGELLVILGPNGAGKSTLLHLLSGSERPAAGNIFFHGRPLREYGEKALARQRSVVSQRISLSLPYTVLGLVLLGRMPHNSGRETDTDYRIAMRALEHVRADHLAERSVLSLSGGELQRVHIARALAQIDREPPSQPALLLLDEPTAHLDIGQSHRLLHLLRELLSESIAIVVVLHDIALAACYADRLLLLNDGSLLGMGTPQEIITPETIRTLYGLETTVGQDPQTGVPIITPVLPGNNLRTAPVYNGEQH